MSVGTAIHKASLSVAVAITGNIVVSPRIAVSTADFMAVAVAVVVTNAVADSGHLPRPLIGWPDLYCTCRLCPCSKRLPGKAGKKGWENEDRNQKQHLQRYSSIRNI